MPGASRVPVRNGLPMRAQLRLLRRLLRRLLLRLPRRRGRVVHGSTGDSSLHGGSPLPSRSRLGCVESAPSPETVATLVGNHREFLAFLQKRVGDRAIAEDILQEAFVRSLAKLETLEQDESAVAWFYRILRNAVVDHYRRRSSGNRKLEAFASELEQHVEPQAEVRGAVCRCVGALASTLKPEYAEALKRVELDGIAVKDYAQEAGITGGNAAVRVFRAREALRKQVARSCGTCADHGCLDCTCENAPKTCC
jgi:RNA polymerase sigma factor (sigma-70 family)